MSDSTLVGVLVVTHGRLGHELVKAAGMIVEETAHIETFSLGWHNNVEKSKAKARGEEKIGFDIVTKALQAPTCQIVDNSGGQGDVVVAQLLERLQKEKNVGYDANTGRFVDMLKAGIIDPAKVARTALQNAASVAALMLTTNVAVTEFKEDDEEKQPIAGAVR